MKRRKSPVYTKTGDEGTTCLVGGTRVPKNHIRVETYGTVDELNAFLGLLRSAVRDEDDLRFIDGIQRALFSIGAYIADERRTRPKETLPPDETEDAGRESRGNDCPIGTDDVERMEREIDTVDERLPKAKSFIIPGGAQTSALCHVCRTVCRRAERHLLTLAESHRVAPELMAYMNRLSDYLFVLSRKINVDERKDELFCHF